ncbi:FAD/NAD(P)-binding domain-containing protein [Agrocybe pediades]|nr:FAD/NAD(P)-binding domain-containing protein [Agrocybe pediades]
MPVDKIAHQDKAAISLKIVIIGGSVAGLATAYALRRAGHDVRVIEKSNGKSIALGGLQSPPNMTRILYRWGLQPLLDRVAHKCKTMVFRKGSSGDLIGAINFDKDFLLDLVADFLLIQDQELKDLLVQLAADEGVQISYSTAVTSVHTSPELATVNLDNGEELTADFIVCADGFDSAFRPLVTSADMDDGKEKKKHLALTYILPVDVINQDDELRPLMDPSLWLLWIGSGYIFHANFINGGKDLSATLTLDWYRDIKPGDEEWSDRPLASYELDFSGIEPRVQKLLNLTTNVTGRAFVSREASEDLVCENSKLVLVGDAAHPMLPGGNHHTAMIFEDAETLRCLFSRIRSKSQISHFLTAYEEIRQPRAQFVMEYDYGFHAMMKLPDGEYQDQRNESLSQSMVHGDWDHMDEATFRSVWGIELEIYTHDAMDKVEDWWTQWGSMISRKRLGAGPDDKRHLAEDITRTPSPQVNASIPGLHRVSVHQILPSV